jgi:hypothetical protein
VAVMVFRALARNSLLHNEAATGGAGDFVHAKTGLRVVSHTCEKLARRETELRLGYVSEEG